MPENNVKVSETQREINNVNEAVMRFGSLVGELKRRLAPVVRNIPTDKAENPKRVLPSTELAAALFGIGENAHSLADELGLLLKNLEL